MTEKLFYLDSTCCSCQATVTGCTPCEEGFLLTFDKTCFFPGGGGHPFDTGTVNGLPLLKLSEEGEEILHLLQQPFTPGTTVQMEADPVRRWDAMRTHTAEHMVSGLFWRMFGLGNIGFHMNGLLGATLDLDGEVTDEMEAQVEARVNALIRKALPVRAFYPSPEELKAAQCRKLPPGETALRLVTVEEADACGCCALHVPHTGCIGSVKLFGKMRHRGGTRLQFICGKAAEEDYAQRHAIVTQLAARFSTQPSGVLSAVQRLTEQNLALKQSLQKLAESQMRLLAQKIQSQPGHPDGWYIAQCTPEEDPAALCKELAQTTHAAVFCQEEGHARYCLMSPSMDLRPLCARLNKALLGRGGGKPGACQGQTETSADKCEAWLRSTLLEAADPTEIS